MPNRAWPAAIVPFQVEMLKRTSNKQSQSIQRTCWLSPHTRIIEYSNTKRRNIIILPWVCGKKVSSNSSNQISLQFICLFFEAGRGKLLQLKVMKCSNCNNIYFICKILEFCYVFVICNEKNVTITKEKLLNYLGKCFEHNKDIPGSKYLIYMIYWL